MAKLWQTRKITQRRISMSNQNSISEKEEKENHIQEFNKWNATIDEQLPKLSNLWC